MNVSIAIQHHPQRAHLIGPLVEALGGHADVVEDPDPDAKIRSPLRTYLRCLSETPDGATHRLVVQDDAWPADGFLQRLAAIVEARPNDLVALFVPGAGVHRRVMIQAAAAGNTEARLRTRGFVPAVALLWPASRAREFVRWAADNRIDSDVRHRSDDGVIARYVTALRLPVFAPVPSIVQHPDVAPSLIGRVAGAGRNRSRVAAVFSGE